MQAYNFDELNYLKSIEDDILMSLSQIFSATIQNVDNLQGMMTNADLLQGQYDLVNEGVVFVNTAQAITKVNRAAEVLFNTTSEVTIGLQVSEFLGTANNHFLQAVNQLTSKQDEKKEGAGEGQIGGNEHTSLLPQQLSQQLIGTYLIQSQGKAGKSDQTSTTQKIPVNFYIHRLTTDQTKTYGFCLIFQPIIVLR